MDEAPLKPHDVNVPETRPALWAGGVPLEIATVLIIATTELLVIKWWYALVMVAIWPCVIMFVRHDYNIARVYWTDIKTSVMALDSSVWGGSSVSAFPVKPYQHFRGIPSRAR